MLFAATRAPSGSNRQPFRFLVLQHGPRAEEARRLIGEGARRAWGTKRQVDRYDTGSGTVSTSPKARLAATMSRFVEDFEHIPVVVLPCLERYRDPTPTEGASIYPGCQNLLLAARALGYGGCSPVGMPWWSQSCARCSKSPSTSSWRPPSPWVGRRGGTDPSAAGRCTRWCSRMDGERLRPGPSTRRARHRPKAGPPREETNVDGCRIGPTDCGRPMEERGNERNL